MQREELLGDGGVAFCPDAPVARIEIHNPPVNVGSHNVRSGLLAALEQIAVVPGLEGVVLMGQGGTFMAGSDIREFGAPLGEPQLPAVIRAIEDLSVPVVAAIAGAALGGGFELALGCDARIAAPDAVVGLPEVGLGLVPGAGGTQRLPRLTGVPEALRLICGSRRVRAAEALELGLVDAVADGDLTAAAIAHAWAMNGRKRPVAALPYPPADADAIEAARAAALKAGKGRPAAKEAIRLVMLATNTPFAEALTEERRVFQEIRVGDEASALRHLFFAERAAGRVEGLKGTMPESVGMVGVVGAGTMGASIAYAFLRADFPIVLVERTAEALAAGTARVEELIAADLRAGRVADEAAAAYRARLDPQIELAACSICDLVVEAVFEDMEVKSALLAELDRSVGSGCILALNTSYLDLDRLAEATARPERVVGLHFFSPAHVMKLLEVVRGAATSDTTLATALAIGRRLGKTAIVAKVGEGFVGNRIYAAYRAEAERLVEDGALPWEVDAALEDFGFAMGPFAVSDLSGLDIAWKTRQRLAATRDPAARYVRFPDLLCEAGRLGRKTGAGWYNYPGGSRTPSPEVVEMIEREAREKGRAREHLSKEEITCRALAALVNEAACVVEDGVAQRASDIDVAFVNGYGFPRWLGGPVWWAARTDRATLLAGLDEVAAAVGVGFRRGPVEAMLAAL